MGELYGCMKGKGLDEGKEGGGKGELQWRVYEGNEVDEV